MAGRYKDEKGDARMTDTGMKGVEKKVETDCTNIVGSFEKSETDIHKLQQLGGFGVIGRADRKTVILRLTR